MGDLPRGNDNINQAIILAENIDPVLISYFEENISGTELGNYFYNNMKEWFMEKLEEGIRSEVTLLNIVYYVLDNIQKEYGSDSRAALKAYGENKRFRKAYLFKVIAEEYKGKPTSRNPLYLHNQAARYFELQSLSLGKSESLYASEQEYIDELYGLILAWKNETLSLLVEFYYFDKLQEKRKYECFLVDMALNLLRIVTEQYNGRYDGGITSLPRELVDSGVFALKNDAFPFEISAEGDKRISTNVFRYVSEEDGSVTTITTSFIDTLDKKNALMTSYDVLNSLDKDTLTTVYTSINPSIISGRWLRMRGKEFAATVLKNNGKLRNRDIIKVVQSVNKLAQANMEISRHAKNGNLMSTGHFRFFEAYFTFNSKDDELSDASQGELINSGAEFQSADFETMDLCNDDWEILIAPSSYLVEQWRADVNSLIYTTQYRKITSHKTRAFMMFVQDERLKNYPESRIFLSFSYVKNSLRMNNLRPAAVKKEIESHILSLIDENIIIKSYIFKPSGIDIEFLPFTESELINYRIKPVSLLDEPV